MSAEVALTLLFLVVTGLLLIYIRAQRRPRLTDETIKRVCREYNSHAHRFQR